MNATWPEDWPERLRGKDCPMCAPRPPGRARHSHPRRPLRDAYLQRATWQPGYTVVTWRGRHVAEPTELDDEEACGY